jgi:UDP-glucose:(heptosyl)LPS alpha-1,3-glucosyltransferase
MEQHELNGPAVQKIIAVSDIVKRSLICTHPTVDPRKITVIYPAVSDKMPDMRQPCTVRPKRAESKLKLLFVGKEWKRKGLNFAVDVLKKLNMNGKAELHVFGPEQDEVSRALINDPNIKIHGWKTDIPWASYDILIHPAFKEPFGMVVLEARKFGIPVLTSTAAGAHEIKAKGVYALSTRESPSVWAQTIRDIMKEPEVHIPEILWDSEKMTRAYLENIYRDVALALKLLP